MITPTTIYATAILDLIPEAMVIVYDLFSEKLACSMGDFYRFELSFRTIPEFEEIINKNMSPHNASLLVLKNRETREYYMCFTKRTEDQLLYTLLPTTDNTQALRAIEKELSLDFLTNILNRKHILERLEQEVKRTKQGLSNACIIIIDIDNFKKVNDIYGHAVGDEVIKFVTSKITSIIRLEDHFGRIGGEEFLLILSNTNLPSAMVVGNKLIKAFEFSSFTYNSKLNFLVSVSMGMTETNFFEELSPSELLAKADEALLAAKSNGKNRYEIIE